MLNDKYYGFIDNPYASNFEYKPHLLIIKNGVLRAMDRDRYHQYLDKLFPHLTDFKLNNFDDEVRYIRLNLNMISYCYSLAYFDLKENNNTNKSTSYSSNSFRFLMTNNEYYFNQLILSLFS